jgi:hypothetical protein
VEYNPIAKPRLSSVAILDISEGNVATDLKDNWSVYLPVILLSFVGMLPIIILAEKFQKHKAMILVAITIMIISQILFYRASLESSVA